MIAFIFIDTVDDKTDLMMIVGVSISVSRPMTGLKDSSCTFMDRSSSLSKTKSYPSDYSRKHGRGRKGSLHASVVSLMIQKGFSNEE